jgi:uncharacterized protein (TIGR03118 family)
MKRIKKAMASMAVIHYFLLSFLFFIVIAGCKKIDNQFKKLARFEQVNLVDNNGEYDAANTDATLINAWGIAFNPTGIAWVSSQAGHVSTIYDKEGVTLRPPVNIPSPGGSMGGNPTGIVFNGGTGFVLSNGQPARFIFVGIDGILSGWNPTAGNNALVIKNISATAAYTGLAIASLKGGLYLYAADFKARKIKVWDQKFNNVALPFKDPGLPSGYSPFNIQAIGDWLYVMYAKVGPEGDEEKGAGLGFVDIYMTNGDFVKRFISKGALNAPWGVAKAPASFFKDNEDADMKTGSAGNTILVGNFGDGRINAYTSEGHLLGALKSKGKPISIEGLWAIMFPPATATTVDPNRLYFAAGPDGETAGLFGYIIKKEN